MALRATGLLKKHGLTLIGLNNHHFAPEALAQVGLANIDFPDLRPSEEAAEDKKGRKARRRKRLFQAA